MDMRSDNQLIGDYRAGDAGALEILISRYLRPVYVFAYRFVGNAADAEDVAQETFLRVWKHFGQFDAARNFKTWAFSIAKNAALDLLKKKKPAAFSDFDNDDGGNAIADTIEDGHPLPSELFDRAGLAAALAAVVAKLPLKQRTVLFMRYTDGFSFREIGEILGEPLHTVKSRHHRAVIALKALLAPEAPKIALNAYQDTGTYAS